MGQGLQLSWFRCMLAFKLPHLLSDPSAAIKGCSPKCSGTDGRVGWVHPDRLHLCATCLASCSSKARDLRSKGRQGHAFTDKGGARANQNSHEQGSTHEPPNTGATSEGARAHTSATHQYAREAKSSGMHLFTRSSLRSPVLGSLSRRYSQSRRCTAAARSISLTQRLS